MAKTWTHLEIWIEREDSEEAKEQVLHVFECVSDFTMMACKDFNLHDPHIDALMEGGAPDWAQEADDAP